MGQDTQYLMHTYSRLPVAFERGSGALLWDAAGDCYLDALGGIAVVGLGHAHPELADVIADQAHTLLHCSNLYDVPLQSQLGKRLCEVSGMDRSFFGNSGAEANETAIKLARRYGHGRGIDIPEVLVTEGAFHGRTLATLTATANRKAHAGFEPLVSGFKRVPFDDLNAVCRVASDNPNVVAVLVEPIQGEGGINIPDSGYLTGLREICDRQGWLLILDEIQTGMCRTGKWFSYQHDGVVPDVLTVAKALGNGVPIGACLARGEAAEVLLPGTHGSTFGGNPLACRVALTVIDILERDRLADRAAELGSRILKMLEQRLAPRPMVRSVRGRGLMIAVELDRPCGQLVSQALEQHLLINVTAETVVRLLPPLVISDEEVMMLVDRLTVTIDNFQANGNGK